MSDVQQAPRETWTKYNHRFEQGRTRDGYAVCTLCGTDENQEGVNRICPRGPLATPRSQAMAHVAAKIDEHIEGYGKAVPDDAPRQEAVQSLRDEWTEFKRMQGIETDDLEALIRSRNLIACECGELIAMSSPIPDHPVALMVKCEGCGAQVRTFEAIKQGLEKQIAQLEGQLRHLQKRVGFAVSVLTPEEKTDAEKENDPGA